MRYELTAKRIKEAMTDVGMSQQELAVKSGIGKSSISHYVNGSNEPGNKSAYALAEVLNVNPAWLMGLDVPKESLETLEKRMVKNRLDFLFLEEDNIPELEQNQADFKKNKEKYERVKEFVDLFQNATPEAQALVENFLKSSQQKP